MGQFERELNLARRASRPADDAKAAPQDDVGRQTKIHFVENIEKLRPKLKIGEFPISAMPKRGVFDQRQVKIVEARTAKRVAAEGAQAAVGWPGPTRDGAWACESRAVCFA